MKELILIRHGESDHHLADRIAGPGSRLTELGRGQARATGRFLAEHAPFAPAAVLSSDLARAAETAALVAEPLHLHPQLSPQLRELSPGAAAGLTRAEARRLERPHAEPALDWAPYLEAESWRALFLRVSSFLAELDAAGRDRLVIVSHGHAMICAINWFLRLTSDQQTRDLMYDLRPCSLTHLRLADDGSRTVMRLNDVGHLAGVG
jgi:probable phosphoglycerate mutase